MLSVSGSAPCPYRLVSSGWLIGSAAHWCQVETSRAEVMVLISCPFRLADSEHRPDGELPQAKKGHVPLIQPDVCHRPVGAAKVGPVVSRT